MLHLRSLCSFASWLSNNTWCWETQITSLSIVSCWWEMVVTSAQPSWLDGARVHSAKVKENQPKGSLFCRVMFVCYENTHTQSEGRISFTGTKCLQCVKAFRHVHKLRILCSETLHKEVKKGTINHILHKWTRACVVGTKEMELVWTLNPCSGCVANAKDKINNLMTTKRLAMSLCELLAVYCSCRL